MPEKYQILARKYRPQKFTEVVGQENIITTLKNSIRFKRVAHAYLFSGPRGVGKTTLARIFAKALNCDRLTDDFEPCGECRSCREITGGRSLDVIEIDGASNRGIDDIRQINETIAYAPSQGQYKIYIIDEVHMLTKEAFNALLKTLEEPPASIKFFFATTEPHKVLPTIVSRCQRFDLLRIRPEMIIKKLSDIAQDLGRQITPEALHLIASFAEGSLRDAESLTDQILCYEEGAITAEVAGRALGSVPLDFFFRLDMAMHDGNLFFAFEEVEKLFQTGKDLFHLTEELVEHFRLLLIAKMQTGSTQLQGLPAELRERYLQSAQLYSQEQALFILDYLISTLQRMQRGGFKKIHIEMALLQIINSKKRITPQTLIRRLIELEKKIESPPMPEKAAPPKPIAKVLPPAEKKAEIPKPADKPEIIASEQAAKPWKHDSVLRFAAVELDGSVKINPS